MGVCGRDLSFIQTFWVTLIEEECEEFWHQFLIAFKQKIIDLRTLSIKRPNNYLLA